MEGLCPSKPPRQRPGGLWKPGFGGGRDLLQMRSLSGEHPRCTVGEHASSVENILARQNRDAK
jgi:hypothetical protein